jgi:hypothetical protein
MHIAKTYSGEEGKKTSKNMESKNEFEGLYLL